MRRKSNSPSQPINEHQSTDSAHLVVKGKKSKTKKKAVNKSDNMCLRVRRYTGRRIDNGDLLPDTSSPNLFLGKRKISVFAKPLCTTKRRRRYISRSNTSNKYSYKFSIDEFITAVIICPEVYMMMKTGKFVFTKDGVFRRINTIADLKDKTLQKEDIALFFDNIENCYIVIMEDGKKKKVKIDGDYNTYFKRITDGSHLDSSDDGNIGDANNNNNNNNDNNNYGNDDDNMSDEDFDDKNAPDPPQPFDINNPKMFTEESLKKYTSIGGRNEEKTCDALNRYIAVLGMQKKLISDISRISQGTISQYCNGKRNIPLVHIVDLAVSMRLYPARTHHLMALAGEKFISTEPEHILFEIFVHTCFENATVTVKYCNRLLAQNNFKKLSKANR